MLDQRLEDVILHFAATEELGHAEVWKLKMTTLQAHDWKTALSPLIQEKQCLKYRCFHLSEKNC